MLRRCLAMVPAALLAGCVCKGETLTQESYASMDRYPRELTACITRQRCVPLCTAVFAIGGDIERCELTGFDHGETGLVGPGPVPGDLATLRGAWVKVTYVEQTTCADDDPWWDLGGWDSSDDDGGGSVDDGSNSGSDDGSMDDGGGDGGGDGSMDDGSDDGGGDPGDGGDPGGDGGGDGGDGGGGDDGGGDLTGSGASGHHAPRPIGHATAPASSVRLP